MLTNILYIFKLQVWKDKFDDAANAIDNREDLIEAAAAELEQDLVLLGATAIEDKLQDGVPETIHNLLRANIKGRIFLEFLKKKRQKKKQPQNYYISKAIYKF